MRKRRSHPLTFRRSLLLFLLALPLYLYDSPHPHRRPIKHRVHPSKSRPTRLSPSHTTSQAFRRSPSPFTHPSSRSSTSTRSSSFRVLPFPLLTQAMTPFPTSLPFPSLPTLFHPLVPNLPSSSTKTARSEVSRSLSRERGKRNGSGEVSKGSGTSVRGRS
jgi:hypothetical protein